MNEYFSFSSVLCALFLLIIVIPAVAQDGPPQYIQKSVQAVEAMLKSEDEKSIDSFIKQSMVLSSDVDVNSLRKRLRKMRSEVKGLWNNIAVRGKPNGVTFTLSGNGRTKEIEVLISKEGVKDLYFVDPPDSITLTRANLAKTFNNLEKEGMAGVVYVQVDGDLLLEKGFGMANDNLKIPNTAETIFGIGSLPIDFTKAAIHLLEQQGKIDQDDTIEKYFEKVPSGKRAMTIRRLMTGQSGLPDFFHINQDWDPDLAWIDRAAAIDRILNQPLIFKPGTDRRHSHAAFVLLAALIEKVSDTPYYTFLDQNFFKPAGMRHTNEYGKTGGHSVSDFAVGGGPQRIGLPNIPPNWGPTSWLIKGSGGMYSTLGDLLKFYRYIRSENLFDTNRRMAFLQPSVTLDGSDRGFELFNAYESEGNQAYLFLNKRGDTRKLRGLFRALEQFIAQPETE